MEPEPPREGNPFELARTLLALGTVQRRAQHKRAARDSLQRAAVYIVIAADPAKSFTAHVEGVQDNQTRTAVLDGRVVDRYLNRAHVHAEFAVISCSQAPSGTCFQGTISVTRSSEDSGD